jgi:hypothetical protein
MGKAVTSRAENETTEWRRLLLEPLGGGGTMSPARVFLTGPDVGIVSGGRCIYDVISLFINTKFEQMQENKIKRKIQFNIKLLY